MSATSPALIAAAAGVGFGHAIMPDHWVPLAVIGRTRRYPLARVARLSSLAGVAHVLVSLLLGGIIVAIGLQFRSTVEHAQAEIVGGVLLATGVAFALLELSGHGHGRDHDERHEHGHAHARGDGPGHERRHDHDHGPASRRGRTRGLAAIMVPLGAAASPDLTILPVFLAASAVGTATAAGSLVAFAAVTVATIVALTLLATLSGHQLGANWLERWGNLVTAGVLVAIGALVIAGAI
jgi:nickel/cobalt transporter (NicO) family protein